MTFPITCGDVTNPSNLPWSYQTTQIDSSSTADNITTSPACISVGFAGVGGGGDGAVIFVTSPAPAWLVAMDPVTGQVATFGQGAFGLQGVSSSPAWDATDGLLYVPGNGGDVEVFQNKAGCGQACHVAGYQSGGAPGSDISDIALGYGSYVFAVENN